MKISILINFNVFNSFCGGEKFPRERSVIIISSSCPNCVSWHPICRKKFKLFRIVRFFDLMFIAHEIIMFNDKKTTQ